VLLATDLVRFLEVTPGLEGANLSPGLGDAVIANLKAELGRVLVDLNKAFDRRAQPPFPVDEISSPRRWLLLYAPRGWRAGIAHFMFYSTVSWLILSALIFSGYDETRDEFLMAGVIRAFSDPIQRAGFLLFAKVPLCLWYWATVERQGTKAASTIPTQRAARLLWYRPVNGAELLARLFLISSAFDLFLIELVPVRLSFPPSMIPPRWHWVLVLFVAWFSLGVAYLWSRAERRASLQASPRPRFPHNLRFFYPPAGMRPLVAKLAF